MRYFYTAVVQFFFFNNFFFLTFNFDWGIPRRESVLFTFLRDKLHCQFARHSYSKSSMVQFFTHFSAPVPQTLFRLGLNVKTLCFRRLLFPPRFQSAASGVLRAFRMKFVVESRGKKLEFYWKEIYENRDKARRRNESERRGTKHSLHVIVNRYFE